MIKNKRYIIITISILLFISIIVFIVCMNLFTKKEIPKEINYQYIEEKISNNENFYLLLINDYESYSKKLFDYYNEVYDLDCDYLIINKENNKYRKLMTKLNIEKENENVETFLVIKKGKVISSFGGNFSEQNLRNYFISNSLIDRKYKNIDYVFKDDEFNNYYDNSKLFVILYINKDSLYINKYRELLVKKEISSLVMFYNDFEQIKTNQFFNEKLKLSDDITNKFPILIKIKNKKIVSYEKNVSLKEYSKYVRKINS